MSVGTSSEGTAVASSAPHTTTTPMPTSSNPSIQLAQPPVSSPPKSAISLQTAAAATPKATASTSSVLPTNHVENVLGKPTKSPGVNKVKQRRKLYQASANDEFIYTPGPSNAGGTIGAVLEGSVSAPLSAAGGNRKAQPELVLPFELPFTNIRPKLPALDNASVQVAMSMGASETSSPDSGTDSDDYSVLSDDSEDDSDIEESRRQRRKRKEPATIEESLILLQSLRQSRLSHLSSLLTPFSQRVRSGMIYPNVLPLSLLHGLNPRDPHVLIQLGRADIHVGPHVFVRTKFWEVRPDYEMPQTMNQAARMRPATFGNTQQYSSVPRPLSTTSASGSLEQPIALKPTLPAVPSPSTAAAATLPATKSPAGASQSGHSANTASVSAVPVQVLPAAPSASLNRPSNAATLATTGATGAVSTSPASTPGSLTSSKSQSSGASKPHVALPQPSMPNTAVALPPPPTVTPSLPRPPSLTQSSSTSVSSTRPAQPVAFAPQRLSAAGAATTTAAQTATTSTTAKPSAAAATESASATPPTTAASRPTVTAPPPPAIDAVLVSRVNATAALNPDLQELLHVAASGKASPTQLKALGVWIQAITAQLREDEARTAAAKAATSGSATADSKKVRKNKSDEALKANKKQAKQEEREAKKKAKADAKAKAAGDKQSLPNHRQHNHPLSGKLAHPPPGWPTDGPPKPPVIILEFRENPSMRFILPLWKCLVERTEGMERDSMPKIKTERRGFFDNDSDDEEPQKLEPELKLSFFAPSLGSDAADGSGLRELEEELKRKAAEEAAANADNTPSSSALPNSPTISAPTDGVLPNDNASPHTSEAGAKKDAIARKAAKAGRNKVVLNETTEESLSRKHEIYPLTWSIKNGVSESLWEAFGRVPGTMTCQPVKREPEIELEPDVAEFLVPEIRYHLLDLPMEEIKIKNDTVDTFVDLYAQMPERHYILPRIAPVYLPTGLEDHLTDKFAVRSQPVQGRPIVKRKAGAREEEASFSYEGIGLTVIGTNGSKAESGPPKPPKRKRHVATHNPDGSLKSCGACGKTKTPMWRRGPKGPSQLCNACGARWKAGRLVVPDVAPPAIIEPEGDKQEPQGVVRSQEDRVDDDHNKASRHGSNALIIPQTSDLDDTSKYNLMNSDSMVGSSGAGHNHASASPPYGESGPYAYTEGKDGLDFTSPHMSRGSASPSPFIRSPIPEDETMPASVDPSMLSGSRVVI